MKVDALVIGAGTAGLTAGTVLARAGLRVLVVATGEGSLPLATGTVDVLGYAPGPVPSPLDALPGFLEANPQHPYRVPGIDGVEHGLAWLAEVADLLGYEGGLTRNRWVPTVAGGLRPTAMVPRAMAAADLRAGGDVLVAGIRGFRDFHPALLAANLSRGGGLDPGSTIRARPVELDWPGSPSDLVPFRLARRFENAGIRRQIADQLLPRLDGATAVALPAVLGRERSPEVQADLEKQLERPVFEVPGLPPSIPGLRLFDCLRRTLRQAGGRLLLGSSAVAATREGDRVRSVTVTQAARPAEVSPEVVLLASGGFATGGIVREPDGSLHEPVFGLPVSGPAPNEEPVPRHYLDDHPLDRAGLRVDALSRPLDASGAPLASNLYAAGAVLAGAEPWREKSGEGLSLATAWFAASTILGGRR